MIKSTLSDTTIMQETTQSELDAKGRVQLTYNFPDGEPVVSVPTVREEIKGSVLIGWCNTVRAADEERLRERQEQEATAARRVLESSSSASSGTDADAKRGKPEPGSTSSDVEPEELAKETLKSLLHKEAELLAQREMVNAELEQVKRNVKRWEAVLKGLELSLEDS